METKQISKAVIKRLPRYYRYLGELMEDNVERISSNELSKKMHTTASQIRQDLNNFGGFGQQGYGYNVHYLYTEIGKILGLDTVHPMIILGAGNLGQALANYVDFDQHITASGDHPCVRMLFQKSYCFLNGPCIIIVFNIVHSSCPLSQISPAFVKPSISLCGVRGISEKPTPVA